MKALKNLEKKYLLLNRSNELVRVINPESNQIYFAKGIQSRRIQTFESKQELNKVSDQFVEIDSLKLSQIKSTPTKVSGCDLHIVYDSPNHYKFSQSVFFTKDTEHVFHKSLKLTALVNSAIILIIMILGYFFHPDRDKTPEEVVQISQKIKIVKPKKVETTSVRKKKVTKKKSSAVKSKRRTKISKNTTPIKRPKRAKNGKSTVSLGKTGALAALGGLSKNKHKSGVNLGKASTSAGAGRGGSQGSGGIQKGFYAKGLKSAPVGPGRKIKGAGGYGTKGKGGGQAGYGKQRISGGSSAVYFSPLTKSTNISGGGLDRDQVNEVITRNRPKIRYCYEKALQRNSKLRGQISIRFVINSKGYVSTAKLAQSSGSAKTVSSCVINQLKTFRFPKPVGGKNVKVSVPFAFSRPKQG